MANVQRNTGSHDDANLLSLVDAAKILDVHRATVNEMVRDGRLLGHRIGPHWYIERGALLRFKATYTRPKNAPKRRPGTSAAESWIHKIVELLGDWHDATADELAQALSLHPGNVRKYLCLAEQSAIVERDEYGSWTLSAEGRAQAAGIHVLDAQDRSVERIERRSAS